jgi:hypothetical protein
MRTSSRARYRASSRARHRAFSRARFAPHLVVAVVASACGGNPASRAGFPDRLEPVPVDTFYSTYVAISHGSRAPIAVENLRARCVDESICKVVVKPPDREHQWPELQILGHAAGKTTVVAEYKHPTREQELVDEIAVELVATPAYTPLAVGEPLPTSGTIVHHIRASQLSLSQVEGDDPLIPLGRCEPGSNQRISGADRADVRMFECTMAVEVAPATHRFRRCTGRCPAPLSERYTVCAQVRAGNVAAARVFESKVRRTHVELEAKHAVGTFDGDACAALP